MSRISIAALGSGICLASLCYADLTGTQVTGAAYLPPSTVNQFDPAVMAEPSYCGNTGSTIVTIPPFYSSQYQFCAIYAPAGTGTGAAPATAIVAQILASRVTIQVSLGTQANWTPFQLTFTDSAFAGMQVAKYTDDFLCTSDGTCGVTASLSGTTLTINGQVPPGGGVFNASFTLTTPGSFSLVAPMTYASGGFSSPTVTWNPASGAEFYTVTVESGSVQTYNSWQIPPNVTSITLPISLLPPVTDITVWAVVNGNWTSVGSDYFPATANLLSRLLKSDSAS